jgi:hypothetical protein
MGKQFGRTVRSGNRFCPQRDIRHEQRLPQQLCRLALVFAGRDEL